MRYAREHVKRYWGFAYRRSIGIAMLIFAFTLAVGTVFTSLIGSSLENAALAELIFWGILIIIATFELAISLAGAHISSTLLMNEREHEAHSKHTGAWLAVLVAGAIAFMIPMLFFDTSTAPIVFMFSFGGILWVLYFSVLVIFNHTYYEVGIGASALWIAFLISMVGVSHVAPGTNISAYALFISTVIVITVTGMTGMSMLYNSSREFVKEFLESPRVNGTADRRRKR